MAKIKNYLLVVLMAFVAFALVGCGGGEVELPAPTEIQINFDIFDGSESDPYVLVGNQMYLSAEVNAGADSAVTWSLAATDRAELAEEDGSAVITAKAAGNIEVTCASVKDPNVKATVTIEVVLDDDYNAVLADAINQIKEQLPVYVAGDFELPKLDNENIKVTYLSKFKDPWADGVFKYVYEGLDIDYQFYVKLSYRGASTESILQVKVVKDVNDNAFINIEKAQQIIDTFMSNYTNTVAGRVINENTEGMVLASADNPWNQTEYPGLLLPGSTTAEQTGEVVKVWWETETVVGGTLNLKKYEQVDAEPMYYVTYQKALLDTTHQLTAFFQLGNKIAKSVYFVTCDGYDPEEVVAYFIEKGLAYASPFTLTKAFISVEALDTTKKFSKVSVEYTVEDPSIIKLTEVTKQDSTGNKYVSGYRIQAVKNGETTVTATFYYDKKAVVSEQPKLDENGNTMLDPVTNEVVMEQVTTYSYAYAYEYKMQITVAR